IWFDTNGNNSIDGGEIGVSVNTTAAGALPALTTLTVPAAAAGAYPVRVDIATDGAIESSAIFTIPILGITLSSVSAVPGTVVTITGTGFTPGTAGTVWFDSNGNNLIDGSEPQSAVTTTAAGALPAGVTLTVPVTTTPGAYPVRADIIAGGAVEASAVFTVPTPALTPAPTSGSPGTIVTITGTNFPLSTAGTIWFDTNGNNSFDAGEPQAAATTTAAGALPAGVIITVPVTATPGAYTVRADIANGGALEASATFTVSAPAITLSPATGVSDTIITITGSGFITNTAGTIWFDSDGNSAINGSEPQVSVTTTTTGTLPAGITLSAPVAGAGPYQVRADIAIGGAIEASSTFTVPTLGLALSPTSGAAGTVVTITGNGFTPGTAGTIWFDTNGNNSIDGGEIGVSVNTTAAGALPALTTLTVPAAAAGTYPVRFDIATDGTVEASAIFTVPTPALTLAPVSGPPGSIVTITGTGFTPGTAGTIWFDTNGNNSIDGSEPLAAVTNTTATGALPTGITITVPVTTTPGAYPVRADIAIGGAVEASATFTVPTPALTLSPASGVAGTITTITGTNFALNITGTIWFDTNGNNLIDGSEPQAAVTTTATGALPAGVTLTIPVAGADTYLVRADIPATGIIEASATFAIPVPAITLSPISGAPGTVITITGTGFSPGAAGTVWFDTNGNNSRDAGEPQVAVTATAGGALPAGVTINVQVVSSGNYPVRADIPAVGTVEATSTFTVPAPTLTLSPASGVGSTVITITGSNFAMGAAGIIWFDTNGNNAIDAGEPQVLVTTTATGAIPTGIALTVPASLPPSACSVRADIPAAGTIEASTTFTIPAPAITLSPASGAPGTVVTITGSGFNPNTNGIVWFDSDDDSIADASEPQIALSSTSTGAIPVGVVLTVPLTTTPGAYSVRADIATSGTIEASVTFIVPNPTISLSAISGPPTTVITVTGSGFTPSTAGVIWFDNNGNNVVDAGEPQLLASTTTAGAIPTGITLTVPATTIAGAYSVHADIPTVGTIEASAIFTVPTPSLTLAPTSGAPGTVITITGSGFNPRTVGVLWFDSNGNNTIDTGEPQVAVTATATGTIPAATTLTVAISTTPGIYLVRADIATGGTVEASATFTTSAPALTIAPTSGAPGTVITITGSGFNPSTAGVIWFDSDGNNTAGAGEPQAAVTTTAAGALPTGITLTVPAASTGTYSVRADIPAAGTVEASGTFAISAPALTLAPTSGAPGTVITTTGTGFTPSTAGILWFDSDGDNTVDAGEPQVAVTTTAAGAIPTGITLTVPATASTSTYSVRADIPAAGAVDASATFTVPALAIALSPSTGISGTVITVSGSGFTPNATGMIWFDSNGDNTVDAGEPQTSVITASDGSTPAGVNLAVPSATAPGVYQIKADIPGGGSIEASASFVVIQPPSAAVLLGSAQGEIILAPGASVNILTPGTAPFTGTISIESTGLRYHVDVWNGTAWMTVVKAGSRNASYAVSGFGLRISNGTTTSMTVGYVVVYLR
ncbi:MAG: GEVED domain-containing protein, partial [Syntrophales bacterium]